MGKALIAAWTRWYYTGLSAGILALALIAFFDNLVTDVGQPSNSIARILIHSFFAAAWLVLLVMQANLVRLKRTDLHRRLGPLVFVVGAGLVVTTAFLFYTTFEGFDVMPPDVMANRITLPLFGVMIFAAWRMRLLAAWHKRLIGMGTILTLSPILSRAIDRILDWTLPGGSKVVTDAEFVPFMIVVWTSLLATQWLYDWAVLKRIHPVTLWATIALYATYGFVYSI